MQERSSSEKKPKQDFKHRYPNLFGYFDGGAKPAGDSPLSEAMGKLQSEEGCEKASIRAAERLLIDALKKSFHSAIRLRREAAAA